MSKLNIPLTPVASSQIQSIGHDQASNTLAILFASKGENRGSLYHYANFTAENFEEFSGADSIGSYFYKNIKNHSEDFPYLRVNQGDEE